MVDTVHLGVDYARMASDPEVQAYRMASMSLQLANVSFDGASLLCNISTGQSRLVVPGGWRRRVFYTIHGLSHQGRKPSQRLIAARLTATMGAARDQDGPKRRPSVSIYGASVWTAGAQRLAVAWSASLQRSTYLSKAEAYVPVPTSRHVLPQSRIPGNLCTAEFIFVRHDAHRGPTAATIRVLEPGDKTFVVDIGSKPDHISEDHLKPGHQDLGR
ncbi:hypothetical protein AAFF_G00072910 [Aldrovandia affinis]|uniref:Uncharacterized protein n=1 Tax=Aldrovandia affinis TaxID=143900 RepID=A0AAD7RYN8_9TELE|nr:hypothetical protein AAFF_G00072910 [Aldrovandia affinis]